ncbi:MAG: flagellar motor stator protein MotA [Campylobacterales bacterium]
MEGGNPAHVLHITSIIIVVPTSLFAAMVSTHPKHIKHAYKELRFVFKKSNIDFSKTIEQLYEFAMIARRDGLLKLEAEIPNIENHFLRKGLDMVVSGMSIEAIRAMMEIEIEETEEHYHGAGEYWIVAGETFPVVGLIGAVLGLMLALQKLDNPQEMAMGIAGAFTATVTGIASSYIIFGPLGKKMIAKSKDIIKEQTIILEGLVGLVAGDNPKTLRSKLYNYIGGEPEEGKKG